MATNKIHRLHSSIGLIPFFFQFHLLFLAIFLSSFHCQIVHHLGPGEGERLKAQLLANLNKYGGIVGQRSRDGPLEPIGAPSPSPCTSPAPPVPPGLTELLALLRPSSTSPQTPSSSTAMTIWPKNIIDGERRFQSQKKQKKERKKEWKKAAHMIGDWRRKMYKMLKSMRRKRGKEAVGISRNSKTEEPVLLFGPPSMIDSKRAQKLAHLFGVETNNRRRKGAAANLSSAIDEWRMDRKYLHSNELKMEEGRGGKEGRRRQTTKRRKGTKANVEEDLDDIYGDELPPIEEMDAPNVENGPEVENEVDADEHFEIVYVPALKRSGGGKRNELEEEEAEDETKVVVANPHKKHHSPAAVDVQPLLPPPSLQPPIVASSAVSLSSPSPPPLPISPENSVQSSPPAAVPVLPLQFPTLLPPLVSFTLPPALNPLGLPLSSPSSSPNPTPLPLLTPINEKEYLRELENVPEDYVDEQERRLPCLQRTATASSQANCKKIPQNHRQLTSVDDLSPPTEALQSARLLEEQFPWDENREMCNSVRLRALIQQGIVPSSVEKSKRALQQRAEAQFGAFYNVICGTGFFSYIAHTDEFCLVAVQDLHCYVFSPVCASQLSFSSGIAKHQQKQIAINTQQRQQIKKRTAGRRRHFLNRN